MLVAITREDPPTTDEPASTSHHRCQKSRRDPPDPDSAEDIERQFRQAAAAANGQANHTKDDQAGDDRSVASNLTFAQDDDTLGTPTETLNESPNTKP